MPGIAVHLSQDTVRILDIWGIVFLVIMAVGGILSLLAPTLSAAVTVVGSIGVICSYVPLILHRRAAYRGYLAALELHDSEEGGVVDDDR